MKYLKYYENMDVDPFGEEDWEEQETSDINIYRLKIGYPDKFFLEELQNRGYRLYNSENKRVRLSDDKIETLIKKHKFVVEYIASVNYFAHIFFVLKNKKITKKEFDILKDISENVTKNFLKSNGRKLSAALAKLISDDPTNHRLKIRLRDLTNHLAGLKKSGINYNSLKNEINRFLTGGEKRYYIGGIRRFLDENL